MGLDMYLNKKTYIQNWDHQPPEEKHQITIKKGGRKHPDIQPKRVTYITEEMGYWRKANHIHQWFVDNVQKGVDDCEEHYVESEDLLKLKGLCVEVMGNHASAQELLPISEGFFFGGTEYDEWYFNSLEKTVEIIDTIMKERNGSEFGSGDLYYHSSW